MNMGLRTFIYGEEGFTNIVLANSLSMLGLDIIGEIDNEFTAFNQISQHRPEVVVLLIEKGQLKAIELGKSLRKLFPKMGIVIATRSEDLRLLGIEKRDLPKGSIVSKLTSHSDLDTLKKSILKAPECTNSEPEFHTYNLLSDTQVETFRLMADGNSNSEIAKMRFVSEKSVEQMLARIAGTLGIPYDRKHNSRIQLLNSYYELVNGHK
jgi:DNA-binding NarL/FixJ family response regulator